MNADRGDDLLFTLAERARRLTAAQSMLSREDLNALIVVGDGTVGPGFNGDFRFLTNHRVIFHRQVLILLPACEPVLFVGSDIAAQTAGTRSFVQNCRVSLDLGGFICTYLKEKGVVSGRVGINFEMMPAQWYLRMQRELPEIEWVETHPQLLEIRNIHSKEEMETLRECAKLADGAFSAALGAIKPGVTEHEIAAAIEYFARKNGAEENFTLIASGKFGCKEFFLSSPTSRVVENGDSVAMEISPRFQGYWTQVVRTVNIGEIKNREMAKMHEVCLRTISEGRKYLGPGSTASTALQVMDDYVKGTEFILVQPVGHNCGVDLDEAKIMPDNDTVLTPGTAMAIHPPICSKDRKAMFYWGETYLITEDGNERLIKSADELLAV